MRWAFSFALNRLFVLAVIVLVMNTYFRTSCGIGNSYVEQLDQWLGFSDLIRALGHGAN